MVNVVVAIGGTGSRAAEAFVHAAATGLMGTTKTYVFIVDKDIDCGNTQRLATAINEYNDFRCNTGLDIPEIEKKDWCIDAAIQELNGGNAQKSITYRQVALAKAGKGDNVLLDLMHSEEEQDYDLQFGFYGHPSLGSAIYSLITDTRTFNNPNANLLFNTIKSELSAAQDVHVFLFGSVFGGTGASLFPSVAESMNRQFGTNPNFHQGGCLMLPYFTFGGSDVSAQQVQNLGDSFLEKTAVALKDYSEDNLLIRKDDKARNTSGYKPARFDALYLLGIRPFKSTCEVYQQGGANQLHSFSVVDLYAGLTAIEFFNDATPKFKDGQQRLLTAELPDVPTLSWSHIPNASIQAKAEKMMRFCDAHLSVLFPIFLFSNKELEKLEFLKKLFGTSGGPLNSKAKIPTDYDLKADAERIAPYCLRYMRFWDDLQTGDGVQCSYFASVYLQTQINSFLDDNGKLQGREYFEKNTGKLMQKYDPNKMLLNVQRKNNITSAMTLQQGLNHAKLDKANHKSLQQIYRAAYDLL